MFKAVNDVVEAAPRKRLLIHSLDVNPEISSGRLGPGLARYPEEMKFPTTLDDSLVYEYIKVKVDTT